jgi:putative transposase
MAYVFNGKILHVHRICGIPLIVEQLGGNVLELVVQPDHVHLFASFPPTIAINQIIHDIKGGTSHQLRKEFPELNSRLPSL